MISSEKNSQIRVLMLVPSLPPLPVGGAEKQALLLADALISKSVTVQFIMPGEGNVGGETQISGVKVYRLNSWPNRIFKYLSSRRKKSRPLVDRIEYDDRREVTNQLSTTVSWPTVVYYNIFYYHALFLLRRKKKEFEIIHAHTMEWSAIVAVRLGRALNKPVIIKDSTMNGFQSLARFPQGKSKQQLIAKSAHFVAMTDSIHENLLNAGISASCIRKIPNGIDTTELPDTKKSNNHSTTVLFVGNLYQQPAKGVDLLLNAWSTVHQKFPNVLLQIVGDGVNNAYREFVNRLGIAGTVDFAGRQHDLTNYYSNADIFVLPSRREGMSNALMEAMLYGLPSVATDISGNRDLLKNRVNGILVPAADIASLAEAIAWMLSHPDERLEYGLKARETILKHYDINNIADQYISLYQNLLNKTHSFLK